MSLADHHEKHFQGGDTVKDIVIGMADGLTVPFALAAYLRSCGANASGGHRRLFRNRRWLHRHGSRRLLAAKSDLEHFQSEQKREEEEILV
jgi:hypothetical protein